EGVVAGAAFEDVVAVTALEVDIAAGPGGGVRRIVAGRAADLHIFEVIGARRAAVDSDADVGGDERVDAGGIEGIIAEAAVDDVLSAVVAAVVAVEGVVAVAAVEDVVAGVAEEGIVAGIAEELVVADA